MVTDHKEGLLTGFEGPLGDGYGEPAPQRYETCPKCGHQNMWAGLPGHKCSKCGANIDVDPQGHVNPHDDLPVHVTPGDLQQLEIAASKVYELRHDAFRVPIVVEARSLEEALDGYPDGTEGVRLSYEIDIQERLAAVGWDCPECGTHNDAQAAGCSNCDYKRSVPITNKTAAYPSFEFEDAVTNGRCPECGTRLNCTDEGHPDSELPEGQTRCDCLNCGFWYIEDEMGSSWRGGSHQTEATKKVGTNWTLEGTPIENGFDILSTSEDEVDEELPFFDAHAFRQARKAVLARIASKQADAAQEAEFDPAPAYQHRLESEVEIEESFLPDASADF